jgi:hypothetical protein
MVHTTVDGTFRQTNLTNESPEYLAKREELRLAEIELMRQRERVAELRRHLPQGAAIQDYQFQEGPCDLNAGDAPARTVRLTELFTKPNRSLVIYHFTYGKAQTKACPMCTAWLDGANGVAHHLAQNLDFAVVAAADLPTLRAHARARSWDKLRLPRQMVRQPRLLHQRPRLLHLAHLELVNSYDRTSAPPDDMGRQKGCKVRIARDTGKTCDCVRQFAYGCLKFW